MRITKRPAVCLLMESEGEDQQLFIQILRDVAPGSVCYIATDPSEAVRILTYAGQTPEYIFIDVKTRTHEGTELVAKIRSMDELKNVPLIIQSSHPAPGEMDRWLELGATNVHIKDVGEKAVRELLINYLE